jgi:translation elongation factor EF-Tu-like GTPase
MTEEKIGVIHHYFSKVGVAAIKINQANLSVGETIHIVGAHTDFTQHVDSMEIDRNPVQMVKAGDDVGIKTKERVREGDIVYRIKEN